MTDILDEWLASDDPVLSAHARRRREHGPPQAAYPSAPQMGANLAHALFDWAISGFSMASDEEQARRLAICAGCPEWDGSRCRICGCFTTAKVKLRTEHCPLPEPKW